MMELFAHDGELTWPVGRFRGADAIRKALAWDVQLSPTAAVRDVGIGIIASGYTVVREQVANLTFEGRAYAVQVLTVVQVDAGLIRNCGRITTSWRSCIRSLPDTPGCEAGSFAP
jgi:hypothetical protein